MHDHARLGSTGSAQPTAPTSPELAATKGRSSKARYQAYLRRRAEALRSRGLKNTDSFGVPAGGEGDPNSPSRTRRSRPFIALFKEFLSLLDGHGVIVVLCVLTVTISALVGLLAPASTKVAIDYILTDHPGPAGLPAWVTERDPVRLLWMLGASLMGVTLVSIVIGMWGRYHMTRLTKRLQLSVRRRVFNHAMRLPLHRVYAIKSGGAASILREDAGQAAELLFSLLYNPWRAVVQIAGTLVILALVDWRLLLGALALIPAAWFSQKTWIARIRPMFREIRNTRQHIDAQTTESFGGMRIVRGFSRQRGEAARFMTSNDLLTRQELLAWWWGRAIEIIWFVLLPLGSTAVLVYGGSRVIHHTLSLGDVMMFSAYLIMLLGPLEALSGAATNIQAQLAGFDRVLDLLDEPVEFQPASEKSGQGRTGGTLITRSSQRRSEARVGLELDQNHTHGHIELRDVWFTYPSGKPAKANPAKASIDKDAAPEWVLRSITLDAPAGSTIALVGPSGAGKTTICNLVARFYDPSKGSVLIDGHDLREVDVDSFRRLLGIVEQDVFLFDGSVRENIAYARRGASDERVLAAAKAANADEFISRLERGYDTLIGERGVRLSGGQKQRLAIARALLADPRILILDEATSNLDSESEALIQDALKELMRSRTCFVIAHRLSTIRNADQIVVIDHGSIIERGTHSELVAREGRYFQMLLRQVSDPDDVMSARARGK